jgi:hypothetical protein
MNFAIAAFCLVMRVRDPETEKLIWLTKCDNHYLAPEFKSKRKAIQTAKQYLAAQRPKYTVSVKELRHEQ